MFTHAALGGTFDHLHLGHKAIIDFALTKSRKITIGIATPPLYTHKEFITTLEEYSYRKKALEQYLRSINQLHRVTLYQLTDIYGSTLTDKSLDSIVVTYETEPNAVRINEERARKGLPPLEILICPFEKGPDDSIIRSTNIRAGLTDRSGMPYSSLFEHDVIYLPSSLRNTLHNPLETPYFIKDEDTTAAEVAKNLHTLNRFTIGVGDIVNRTLRKAGFEPDIQIIDLKTQRQHIKSQSNFVTTNKYPNKSGTLNIKAVKQLYKHIQDSIHTKHKSILVIEGEEDLLTLPAILFSPLKSIIVYGQRDKGIVILEVTEKIKEKITEFVKQFTTTP